MELILDKATVAAKTMKVCPFGVGDIIGVIIDICRAVIETLKTMKDNSECCERIKRIVLDLKQSAYELKKFESHELSNNCRSSLRKLNESLHVCNEVCKSLQKQGKAKQFLKAGKNKLDLKRLENELKSSLDSLQFALQIAIYAQLKEMKETVAKEIKNTVVHNRAGIYENPQGHTVPPHSIERPNVSLNQKRTHMFIKWKDTRNDAKNVANYEISLDEEKGILISFNPQKSCSGTYSWGSEFSVTLGDPTVHSGDLYNVKIRAVNGAGPGDWSETYLFRFKSGPPDKPQILSIIELSPTEVLLKVKILSVKEEGGSPIHACRVEFAEVDDHNATRWNIQKIPMKRSEKEAESTKKHQNDEAVHTKEFKVTSLKANTVYRFRIIMVNGIGVSHPSDSRDVCTDYLVPGPPQNVRIASKRTSTTLIVRWEEPLENSEGVHDYRVEYRRRSNEKWMIFSTVRKNKHSLRIHNLKTDTEYVFRVQSLNEVGDGNYSTIKEGETRYGRFGRTVGTATALVVGTAAAPVIGGVVGGGGGAIGAHCIPSSKTGKRVAAVAGGVTGGIGGTVVGLIGAPFIGVGTAIVTNKILKGNSSDSSLSSDEESDN